MIALNFTTKVLGEKASARLINHQVTQTIRARHCGIVQAGLTHFFDVAIRLDECFVGIAQISNVEETRWSRLDGADAQRGGFDSLEELEDALLKAGYRFKALDDYQLYRVQFIWSNESLK